MNRVSKTKRFFANKQIFSETFDAVPQEKHQRLLAQTRTIPFMKMFVSKTSIEGDISKSVKTTSLVAIQGRYLILLDIEKVIIDEKNQQIQQILFRKKQPENSSFSIINIENSYLKIIYDQQNQLESNQASLADENIKGFQIKKLFETYQFILGMESKSNIYQMNIDLIDNDNLRISPSQLFEDITRNLNFYCISKYEPHKFHVIRILGEGSFATVFKVRKYEYIKYTSQKKDSYSNMQESDIGSQYQEQDNFLTSRTMALKVIKKSNLITEQQKQIKSEIKIMRKVTVTTNPLQFVHIWQVMEDQENLYIFQDYKRGGTLKSYIKQEGYLKPKDAKIIITKIFQAVSKLHSLGIVHRDLTLCNILLDEKPDRNNRVGQIGFAIADFGLSTKLKDKEQLSLKCGTPGFIAPEILSNQIYSTKADIFSLGAIFYMMISGSYLFYGKDQIQVLIQNKLCNTAQQLKGMRVQMSKTQEILCQLLSPHPDKRPSAQQALKNPILQVADPRERSYNSNDNSPRILTNITTDYLMNSKQQQFSYELNLKQASKQQQPQASQVLSKNVQALFQDALNKSQVISTNTPLNQSNKQQQNDSPSQPEFQKYNYKSSQEQYESKSSSAITQQPQQQLKVTLSPQNLQDENSLTKIEGSNGNKTPENKTNIQSPMKLEVRNYNKQIRLTAKDATINLPIMSDERKMNSRSKTTDSVIDKKRKQIKNINVKTRNKNKNENNNFKILYYSVIKGVIKETRNFQNIQNNNNINISDTLAKNYLQFLKDQENKHSQQESLNINQQDVYKNTDQIIQQLKSKIKDIQQEEINQDDDYQSSSLYIDEFQECKQNIEPERTPLNFDVNRMSSINKVEKYRVFY